VPISLHAMMRAIELNGVEVDKNRKAFGWGRIAAVDMDRIKQLMDGDSAATVDTSLDDVIRRRADFLVDYQDQALSDKYSALVERVRNAEDVLDGQGDLTDAVARSYFKFLSYKDEYEVARLYTQTGFLEKVRRDFGDKAKLTFHLAPPVISRAKDARGRPRKKEFGGWMVPAFRLLAKMRGLRGTRLDLFALTADRRLERALIGEFEATIEKLLSVLDKQNIGDAEAVVRLYMDIRGYGPVKAQAAVEVRAKIAAHAIMQA